MPKENTQENSQYCLYNCTRPGRRCRRPDLGVDLGSRLEVDLNVPSLLKSLLSTVKSVLSGAVCFVWSRLHNEKYVSCTWCSLAKSCLTVSASSVPVEAMFNLGLILNLKRSALAAYRANILTFIHDNYFKYFPVNPTVYCMGTKLLLLSTIRIWA